MRGLRNCWGPGGPYKHHAFCLYKDKVRSKGSTNKSFIQTYSSLGSRGYGLGFGEAAKIRFFVSIPHPVMGAARDYCRYIKVLLTPSEGVFATMAIDLTGLGVQEFGDPLPQTNMQAPEKTR